MAIEDVVTQADQATTTTETAPAAPAVTPTTDVDADDAELVAARAALTGEPAATATPTTETPPATPAPKPAAVTDDVMIPKARLDEALGKMAAKDLALAKAQGEIEALKLVAIPGKPGTATPAAPAAPTVEDRLTAANAEMDALAKQFDDGEIGMAAFKKAEREINTKIEGIRDEHRAATATPQAASADDIVLNERTDALYEQHPYTKLIDNQADWEFLHGKALQSLAAEGVVLPAGEYTGPQRLMVRTRIAELTDTFGPALTGKTVALPKTSPKPAAPSPIAQAREDKLALAVSHAPNIGQIQTAGTGTGEMSEAQIAALDDEAIGALPASIRQRFAPTQ